MIFGDQPHGRFKMTSGVFISFSTFTLFLYLSTILNAGSVLLFWYIYVLPL